MVLILFIILVFLFIILSWVWPPDSPWAPWWRTNKKTANAICKLANIKKEDVIYDLGCGDGEVLITAASKFGARGVGIEIDILRFFIANIRVRQRGLSGYLNIRRSNFFKQDISPASVVIVYLVPATLKKLLPKFKKDLKKGTRIISYRYDIEGLVSKKVDLLNDLRLYTI